MIKFAQDIFPQLYSVVMKVSGVIYCRQLSQNLIYISCKLNALKINKKKGSKQNVESWNVNLSSTLKAFNAK